MIQLFALLAILVAVAGLAIRSRLRRLRRRHPPRLDEDMIRRIEREGRVETDEEEPLDIDEIRRQEREFWSETWDEPEQL